MSSPLRDSDPALWDGIWREGNDDEARWWVERESSGVRGGRIRAYLRRRFDTLKGLRAIEVGAGAGTSSLAMARLGVDVTLLDYNAKALAIAGSLFEREKLPARLIQADAFDPPKGLLGAFDVAMSFGTIEHFHEPRRTALGRAHVDFVKPAGVVILSVPHRRFLPHELLKRYLIMRGRWSLGYEGAFSKRELAGLGERLGLEDVEIHGSGVRTDLARYRSMYANTSALRRVTPASAKRMPAPRDRPSRLDNVFGSDIYLLGARRAGGGAE